MPKIGEEHLEARRRQILDAAFVCFAGQGFHKTTMQDICSGAQLSPGAVYRYFRSKEEIIAAICGECQERNNELASRAESVEDTLARLDSLADEGFAFLSQPESQPHLQANVQLWAEAVINPSIQEALSQNTEALLSAMTKTMRQAQEKGEVDGRLDARAAARTLMAMWYGTVLQKALNPGEDFSQCLEVIKSMYSGRFWLKKLDKSGNGRREKSSRKRR
ncbi:MAG: TetR/AcrR family transcriptional regulator [SAR202 cluster bacterium]|nr:TetR/AcrR family transcriptional regulator [SAR202 cluster bacterium]